MLFVYGSHFWFACLLDCYCDYIAMFSLFLLNRQPDVTSVNFKSFSVDLSLRPSAKAVRYCQDLAMSACSKSDTVYF